MRFVRVNQAGNSLAALLLLVLQQQQQQMPSRNTGALVIRRMTDHWHQARHGRRAALKSSHRRTVCSMPLPAPGAAQPERTCAGASIAFRDTANWLLKIPPFIVKLKPSIIADRKQKYYPVR
jgi:hypothetical protein